MPSNKGKWYTVEKFNFQYDAHTAHIELTCHDYRPNFDMTIDRWYVAHYTINGGRPPANVVDCYSNSVLRPHEVPDDKQERIEMLRQAAVDVINAILMKHNQPIQLEFL